MAPTPSHTIRVPDHVWQAALDKAHDDRTTVTAVIVRALTAYAVGR